MALTGATERTLRRAGVKGVEGIYNRAICERFHHVLWLCACVCGNRVTMRGAKLRAGRVLYGVRDDARMRCRRGGAGRSRVLARRPR